MSSNPRSKSPTRQLSLHDPLPVGSTEKTALKENLEPRRMHGGLRSQGKRKTIRPFQAKAPLHIVLRSNRAKGQWSLLHRKNEAKVLRMIYVYADRFKVKVYRASNIGKELHLVVKASERKHLADYLRVLAGRVAVVVTGAQKYVKRIGKFWEFLYWSRLVNWGKDFYGVREFVKVIQTDVQKVVFDENDEFYWKKIPHG